jgi:serine/threonine protein kinase
VGAAGEKVAVKFEKHGARCPQLRHEYKVYRELANADGFAKVHYFGTQDSYNLMVMDLLGPSLEDQFNKCGRRFTLKTVLMLADQMLERVELMHSRHLIHRDIKPANFVTDVTGEGKGTTVYCIDFGLSKRYRHPRTLQHIPQREGRSLTGTPRYASVNNHLGVEQSRRDDLESIGYVLIYFLKGGLPWQGLKAKSASKQYKLIMEKKQSLTIPQLGQGCPNQFAEYLAYCRSLKFEAKPNIAYLRGMFRELFRSQGYSNNLEWDWSRLDNPRYVADQPVPLPDDPPDGQDVEILNEQPMDLDARPDTAAAVGRPDTAAAIRPTTANTLGGGMDSGHHNRRSTAPSTYFDGNGVQPSEYRTYNGVPSSSANAGGAQPRPSTASRINNSTQQSAAASGSGPGTRPSTAYGLRTSGAPHQAPAPAPIASNPSSGSAKAAGSGASGGANGEHVVAGARGMMRYRRTRAATDGQVDGLAWNNNGASSRLPNGSSQSKTLQQRKGEATPAWDHRPGSTGGTRSGSGSGAYKFDSRMGGSSGGAGRTSRR